MSLEKLTSEINQQISKIQEDISVDKIPDYRLVQKTLDVFTSELKNMDAAIARQYTMLLSVWGEELRKTSEALNQRMAEIKNELNGIQNQNKAIKSYNSLSFNDNKYNP